MKSLKTLALVLCMAVSLPIFAQSKAGGGIDADMLRQITQQSASKSNAALSNAMASNSIDDLAKNYRNTTISDTHFSIETPKQSIHNQLHDTSDIIVVNYVSILSLGKDTITHADNTT